MHPDDFELLLRDQPWRPVPGAWREEILDRAEQADGDPRAAFGVHRAARWQAWLWPSPPAWAGLAATWLAILALNYAGRWEPFAAPGRPHPLAPARWDLAEHRRYLHALLQEADADPAPPRSPAPAAPRSALTVTHRLA